MASTGHGTRDGALRLVRLSSAGADRVVDGCSFVGDDCKLGTFGPVNR
jgi:hypothetical protein